MNSSFHIGREQRLKLLTEMTKEQRLKLFKEITDHFIGEKATLFSYTSSLGGDLYISLEKGGRCFLIKFSSITYIKTCNEWVFGGLKIELKPEDKQLNSPRYYKLYDRHYLEVICTFFWVIEFFEDEDIANASINENISNF